MRTIARVIAVFCFAAALGQALVLHWSTGGRLFTQLPSQNLAKMQDAKPSDDAFAGLGMNDLAGEPTKVDDAFRFGWLPAGPGNSFADSASVLTMAGPAFVLLVLAWAATRLPRAKRAA
jgi:hypothetical protein